jgi:hypothetical protein
MELDPPACGCTQAPHRAAWVLLDIDRTNSRVLARACDTSLPQLLAHVLTMSAMLLALVGCGDRASFGALDAGDAGEHDGNGHVVDLVDADAGELEHDAAAGDAGELADARADGEDLEGSDDAGDAGELEHDAAADDAGAQLEQCTDDKHTFLCRAARCATVCQVASNLMCCDDAGAVLCACEVSP